jgi:hypothetical protein
MVHKVTHDCVMSVVTVLLNSQSELCKIQHESCATVTTHLLGKHVLINC